MLQTGGFAFLHLPHRIMNGIHFPLTVAGHQFETCLLESLLAAHLQYAFQQRKTGIDMPVQLAQQCLLAGIVQRGIADVAEQDVYAVDVGLPGGEVAFVAADQIHALPCFRLVCQGEYFFQGGDGFLAARGLGGSMHEAYRRLIGKPADDGENSQRYGKAGKHLLFNGPFHGWMYIGINDLNVFDTNLRDKKTGSFESPF